MKQHRAFEDRLAAIRAAIPDEARTGLDLGCQRGEFSSRLADRLKMVAVDRYDGKWPEVDGVRWLVQNMTAADLWATPEVDVILALNVLHHMEDWREALEALRARARLALIVEPPHPGEHRKDGSTIRRWEQVHAAVSAVSVGTLVTTPATFQPEIHDRTIHLVGLTPRAPRTIRGVPDDGFGLASQRQRRYPEPFAATLGYEPFPGTLNLRLEQLLDGRTLPSPAAEINTPEKSFVVWRAEIAGLDVPAHLSRTARHARRFMSQRADRVELLAPIRLRNALPPHKPVTVTVFPPR